MTDRKDTIFLNEQECQEEEKKVDALQRLLVEGCSVGKDTVDSATREILEKSKSAWLEILMQRYLLGKLYAEALQEGEEELRRLLRTQEYYLRQHLGSLYEHYPERPTRQEAARCMYFYQVAAERGLIVPGKPKWIIRH